MATLFGRLAETYIGTSRYFELNKMEKPKGHKEESD